VKANRYLLGDPLPWLLRLSGPEIRYLTLRDIPSAGAETVDIDEARNRLAAAPRLKELLASGRGGVMGDATHFDIYYRGAMWCFCEAVARGLDRHTEAVASTAEFLLSRCVTPDGGFIMNWKPPIAVACRTGDMVRSLIMAGYDDERVRAGIGWIARHQRHDGGWLHCPLSGALDMARLMLFRRAGRGLSRENDSGTPSCVYATAACLRALTAGRGLTDGIDQAIAGGAEFLLRRRLFAGMESGQAPVCDAAARGRSSSLGFPLMGQYDVLYGLLAVAEAGRADDPRTGGAFNLVMEKQNEDGSWNQDNTAPGMLLPGRAKDIRGRKSPWVTLNGLRFLTAAGLL